MSGARKTAHYSFPGITHISEKIFRGCSETTKAVYNFDIVPWVTHGNIKANESYWFYFYFDYLLFLVIFDSFPFWFGVQDLGSDCSSSWSLLTCYLLDKVI